jgi:hypothetical protein
VAKALKPGIVVAAIAHLLLGCCSTDAPVARDYLEDDPVSNYRRVFGISPPEEIDVVNSVVVAYEARPGLYSRDDWAFELVAPDAWIARTARNLHLAPAESVNKAVVSINERKEQSLRPWYAPKPITEYELYYLLPTDTPHIHMLVDAEPEPDGRHRVFISKQ